MEEYLEAKRNILDYIKDKDKFNKVYNNISLNIEIVEHIANTVYKNSYTVDKELLLSFCEHLKNILEEEKEKS